MYFNKTLITLYWVSPSDQVKEEHSTSILYCLWCLLAMGFQQFLLLLFMLIPFFHSFCKFIFFIFMDSRRGNFTNLFLLWSILKSIPYDTIRTVNFKLINFKHFVWLDHQDLPFISSSATVKPLMHITIWFQIILSLLPSSFSWCFMVLKILHLHESI